VRGGEPVFNPAPEVIKTVKLSGTDAVDTPPSLSQILSKPQTQALLRVLAGVKSGCVLRLEVRDSQPCYVEIGLSATEEATRA
jgi:hypothetical protein